MACNVADAHGTHVAMARYLKVATAVAIIKSCPKGISPREFAEQLYNGYQLSLLEWKSKAEKLDKELLTLRQAVMLKELQNQDKDLSSQDESYGECNIYLTPPCSSEYKSPTRSKISVPENVSDKNLHDALQQHTRFFQSLMSFGTLSKSDNLKCIPSEYVETMCKSIRLGLNAVVDILGSESCPSSDAVNQKLPAALRVMDRLVEAVLLTTEKAVGTAFFHDLHAALASFISQIVVLIIVNQSLCNFEMQDKLSWVIVKLSTSPHLLSVVVHILSRCITDFAHTLQVSTRKHDHPLISTRKHDHSPIACFKMENLFYILRTLELVLVEMRKSGHTKSVDAGSWASFQEVLDTSLLHVSDKYPLLAHYI